MKVGREGNGASLALHKLLDLPAAEFLSRAFFIELPLSVIWVQLDQLA